MSSLFLMSKAIFLRAVATAQTTLSLSILSNSTRMGRPFSLRTAARMYTDHWQGESKEKTVIQWKLATVIECKQTKIAFKDCYFNSK